MDELGWRVVRTIYPVLATVALTGIFLNSLLLISTIRNKSLRSATNILIGFCALFDVIHQIGYMIQFPILFSDYYIDSFKCSFMQFLPELGLAAGAFCVLSIGFDRFLSALIATTYRRVMFYFLKLHLLLIVLFCSWVGYLMVAYWTSKKLVCGMPSPFHGEALGIWTISINIVNVTSIVVYFVTWRVAVKRTMSKNSKKALVSIALVMTFEVTGWFISLGLINLSRIIALPEHRPPFHHVACTFVNCGIAFKTFVYYSQSAEYRHAIRSTLGLKKKTTELISTQHSSEVMSTF